MIHITPNTWLCEAYKNNAKDYDQFYTPRQYLWQHYQGDMQPAPESVILAALYDLTQNTTESQQLLTEHRFLQRHLPYFLDNKSHQDNESFQLLQTLKEKLHDLGLWETSDILKTSNAINKPLSGLGWVSLPTHLKSWIKPTYYPVENNHCYVYEHIDDQLACTINMYPQRNVTILVSESDRSLMKMFLLQHNINYNEDRPKAFETYPKFINILALLELDMQAIEPKSLLQLLWMQNCMPTVLHTSLFTQLHAYPKPFCTINELKSFLSIAPSEGSRWLLQLISLIPSGDKTTNIHLCLSHLEEIFTFLQWPKDALWPLWLNMLASTAIIREKRTFTSWWKLLRCLSAMITTPLLKQHRINIVSASRALFSPKDIIFIPNTLQLNPMATPPLPTEEAYLLSQQDHSDRQVLTNLFESYRATAKPLTSNSTLTKPLWHDRVDTTLPSKYSKKIRWVSTIKNYTLCPRYGWIHTHLIQDLPSEPSFDLTPSLKGILLHDWMQSNRKNATDFIHSWLKRRGLPVNTLEVTILIHLLEKISSLWQELLQQHPWMQDAEHEKKCILELGGYQGELRLDLILRHPKGLVIIDFKSTALSLSPLYKHAGLAPQLPLYWMTQPETVIALGYAQLTPDAIVFTGIAKEEIGLFPKTHNHESWHEQYEQWKLDILQTLKHIDQNNSDQTPFQPHQTCDDCRVRTLCKP